MATYQDYEDVLRRNYGTLHWYKYPSTVEFVFTDGIMDMAKTMECAWLVDVVASRLPEVDEIYQNDEDNYFFFVTLNVQDNKADFEITYSSWNDELDDEVYTTVAKQHIQFTDMPDGEYELYLQADGDRYTLCLPSER